MTINKTKLKKIIKEEVQKYLKEGHGNDYDADAARLGFDPRSTAKSFSDDDFEDTGLGNVGDAILSMTPVGDRDGFVPWDRAEEESGFSKEELIDYIERGASDSEKYYMKYNDDGLDLYDPMSV